MAVLLQGTTDMHDLLHCYESTNGSSSSKCLACACSASPATWQCCECMLHQRCGQDYLKNLLKLILHFYHFCSFCTSYWRFIKYCAYGFEWSHVCLEYLFVFSAEPSDMTAEFMSLFSRNHINIIQVLCNHHHHCDWCFYFILHLNFLHVYCWYLIVNDMNCRL